MGEFIFQVSAVVLQKPDACSLLQLQASHAQGGSLPPHLTPSHPIPWQDHQLILAWYLEGICPRKDPKEAPCSKSLFSLTMWSLSSVSHELPDQACGPFPIHHGQVIPFSLHQLFMDKPFQRTTGLLGDVSHISKQGVWSSQFSFW